MGQYYADDGCRTDSGNQPGYGAQKLANTLRPTSGRILGIDGMFDSFIPIPRSDCECGEELVASERRGTSDIKRRNRRSFNCIARDSRAFETEICLEVFKVRRSSK